MGSKKIQKILIANRGEIAVRIIRTARTLGIKTVAVYSEADAHSMYVQLADESVPIGGSMPSESYLRIDTILSACQQTGADAVHPGYGFLSEKAEFSEACASAGISFLGPSANAMRMLGGKIDAKRIAVENNVPITPGYFQPGATDESLKDAAINIGFPVMLKASAGGGGRGMRIVRDLADFQNELEMAKDEALKGFGDDAMMVEKLVDRPRHIEVQFIADSHGNVACLFERECSIQRRHQKLVEEAPSPYIAGIGASLPGNPEMWDAMRAATQRLAKAAGYVGAGTAEYMVDDITGEFYFLEVNARLQVEHPVSEAITGLDLVALQIAVAQGDALNLNEGLMQGTRSTISGHAIEVRIVAEDPATGFLPSIGKIVGFAEPRHPGVRVDTGVAAGSEVTRFYDSMIAKVIAHGENREQARLRLIEALLDFHLLGVKSNVAYVMDVLRHPEFIEGKIDTGFLGREFDGWTGAGIPAELGSIAQFATSSTAKGGHSSASATSHRSWDVLDGWRNVRPHSLG